MYLNFPILPPNTIKWIVLLKNYFKHCNLNLPFTQISEVPCELCCIVHFQQYIETKCRFSLKTRKNTQLKLEIFWKYPVKKRQIIQIIERKSLLKTGSSSNFWLICFILYTVGCRYLTVRNVLVFAFLRLRILQV